ncbi:alpha-1,3-mannosyl-glycoprotein 4-beta-N-acetylglucosaminyltransferase C-like isoform X1 [Limulus polyphemus]|uniref:Alpha-1,3-mannosyl-glycoprotein 4-beta-N-acetylglucosaminyltransferase C-like isoform X1 n=2 Tax=Limulus polyphemus TaxID=6850 RepID=A0ABM1BIZ7_LIMPO|nr:alpha-1,3-mannosyl-glycoprotein 4-beta-N-acetylglucosaminyltransferase C-like isoform X1 [Limulus polyphemus]
MKQEFLVVILLGCFLLMLTNCFWMLKYSQKIFIKEVPQMLPSSSINGSCESMIRETVRICSSEGTQTLKPKYIPKVIPVGLPVHHLLTAVQNAKIVGRDEPQKKFLTIGIPSVARKKGNYISSTLNSLINRSTAEEQRQITVVVLLADSDSSVRMYRAKWLSSQYKKYIDSGFLHIIETVPDIYPSFENLRHTFNDPDSRVRWRAKQVVDFAFSLSYGMTLSEYYLILEDDVECAPHYVKAIQEFIKIQKKDWVSLSFTGFLIIGRLLKSSDLERLVSFLMLFYSEKPVDLLILQYIDLMVPSRTVITRRVPSLFQHVGIHSSLDGKVQKLKDKKYSASIRKYQVVNPEADLVTSMKTYETYYPEMAYGLSYGYFWAMAPKANDTLDIIFHEPQNVTKIYIMSGSNDHVNDILVNGVLQVSPHFINLVSDYKAECENFVPVAGFEKGIVNVTLSNFLTQCVRIKVTMTQKNWLVISEIAIFK